MGAGVPIECDPTELGTFGTNVPLIPELIAEGALAVQQGLTVMDIATTIHAHPTLSEIMLEASQKAAGS